MSPTSSWPSCRRTGLARSRPCASFVNRRSPVQVRRRLIFARWSLSSVLLSHEVRKSDRPAGIYTLDVHHAASHRQWTCRTEEPLEEGSQGDLSPFRVEVETLPSSSCNSQELSKHGA